MLHYPVERLAEHFGEADVDIEILSPSALGLEEIGHFGFFHRRIGPAMWPQWMDFLTSQRAANAR